MKNKNNENLKSLIPLHVRIGVTGHRNISLTPELKEAVRKSLSESAKRVVYPKSKTFITPLVYSIITPLAEGADRIIAEQAKELFDAKIDVVLPMIKEEYEETFLLPASVKEFESFLGKANSVRTLINKPLGENYPTQTFIENQHIAFQKVGRYIVDNCDILIALWDGKSSEKPGGTAEVVEYARQKRKSLIIISSEMPHSIFVELGRASIKECASRYEAFNKYPVKPDEINSLIEKENRFFFPEKQGDFKNENLELVKEKLLPLYAKASITSGSYQKLYKNTGSLVHILTPLAVASVAAGIFMHNLSWLFFLLEFLILSTIIISIYTADKKRAHNNWIQTRYLTELFRMAIYMTACGIKPSHIKLSPHLRVAHDPEDWMVHMYDDILSQLKIKEIGPNDDCSELKEYVKKNWVNAQIAFHQKKNNEERKKSSRFELLGIVVFFAALIFAFFHILLSAAGLEESLIVVGNWLAFGAIILPALGASFGAIRSHREYSRLSKRSKNMVNVLNELLNEFDNTFTTEEFIGLVYDAEDIMLHESQDWLMLMRFTKLEAV